MPAVVTNYQQMYDNLGSKISGSFKGMSNIAQGITNLFEEMEKDDFKQRYIKEFLTRNPEAGKYIDRLNLLDKEQLVMAGSQYVLNKEKLGKTKTDMGITKEGGANGAFPMPDFLEKGDAYQKRLNGISTNLKKRADETSLGIARDTAKTREEFVESIGPRLAGTPEGRAGAKAMPEFPAIGVEDPVVAEVNKAKDSQAAIDVANKHGRAGDPAILKLISQRSRDETNQLNMLLKELRSELLLQQIKNNPIKFRADGINRYNKTIAEITKLENVIKKNKMAAASGEPMLDEKGQLITPEQNKDVERDLKDKINKYKGAAGEIAKIYELPKEITNPPKAPAEEEPLPGGAGIADPFLPKGMQTIPLPNPNVQAGGFGVGQPQPNQNQNLINTAKEILKPNSKATPQQRKNAEDFLKKNNIPF